MTSTSESEAPDKPRQTVSRTVLIVGVVAALALGGLAGVAIGWKVEQSRVKDDIKNIRPVGVVTAVNGNSVTVDFTTSSGTRTYALTDSTIVDAARSGTTDAVARGATVLVKSGRGSGGGLEAAEIIVLPRSTTFGKGG